MHQRSAVPTALCLLLSVAPQLAAQAREPEIQTYSFVSEARFAGGVWVNPAAQGFNGETTRVLGFITFDRPEGADWATGQYLIGLQARILGLGYRHDEFSVPGGFANGDAYTLALGVATGRNALGVSRTWRTVGPTDGSWEIGWQYHGESGVSAGLVWRDLGSPQVRGVVRRERLIGALTFRPAETPVTASLELDYRTDGGDFRAFKLGASISLAPALRAHALADWDGDGDFRALRIGISFRRDRAAALGGVGFDKGGDARTASVGLGYEGRSRGR